MKMANKVKKPIRQTNTANQVRRAPNYNNSNILGNNNNINQRQNYNNINYKNNMNYNYSSNASEIGKKTNQYSEMKPNTYKKPITANQYMHNHNYNKNNLNKDNIYNSPYNSNKYNINNNNNFNNNYSNYNNNLKNKNIRRNNNNYNYNNDYNNNYNNINENDDDERPIGGGLTADQMPDENSPTSPCPHCGRNFNSQALIKHVKICEKVFLKKRKAFNTQKQRIQDSEQASLMKQGAMEAKRNPLLNNKKTGGIPKWKLQSMAFRAICNPEKNPPPNQLMNMNKNNRNMKNNKNMNNNMNMNAGNNGYGLGGGGGFVSNAIAYDYKHCEFCNRNYNEEAYNKHLNFCKRRYENEKLKNKAKKSNNAGNKNQYGGSLSSGVQYNKGKYNRKK